jgi:hypothetical protein
MTDETIKGYLDYLPTVRGMKGYTLQAGTRLLVNQLPAKIHGAGDGVCTLINEFLNAYHEYGRPVQQACFETAEGVLVVLREAPPAAPLPPPSEPTLIAILAEDATAVPSLLNAGSALLTHCGSRLRTLPKDAFGIYNAPPDSDWTYFKTDLMRMIGKVVGSAQSEKLLQRVQAELGLDRGTPVPNAEFKRLGEALIAAVPNRSRQDFLREELNHLLSEFA